MRLLYFVPGSGSASYCENCLRDGDLMDALQGLGHEVTAMPLYLPPMLETERVTLGPLFYGGINVYLRERLPGYARAPGWLRRMMDRPGFLEAAGRRSGATDPVVLATTAQSMLAGEDGGQAAELARVVAWLEGACLAPDVVVLSNALLGGLAARLKALFGVPVVTLVQDEHEFLDVIPETHSGELWRQLREALGHVSRAVVVSRFYSRTLAEELGFEARRQAVIYPGIRIDQFPLAPRLPEVPALGFLSRWSPDKAPHRLAESFAQLRQHPRLARLQLHFAGGCQTSDKKYLARWRPSLAEYEQDGEVTFTAAFDLPTRRALFGRTWLLVVTESQPPAFRRYVLESLCQGTVVLAPAIGCFPELAALTDGGIVLYDDPAELTGRAEELLLDPAALRRRGEAASHAVRGRFDVNESAAELVDVLTSWLEKEQER
jgi:glycosyltransferase involved in cell wall biosynthesis